MRRPFFSGNYGSALGSTANAANLIAQAGATQGQMYANLGQQLGGAISSSLDKFRLNKEKKEKEQRAENQFLNLYEGNPENPIFKNLGIQSTDEAKAVAKDISKDPQLIQQAMKFAQFATVQQQAQEASQVRNLQKQQLRQSMENQRNTNLQAKQNQMSENQFMQSLMSQTASPQAQRQADIAMPGLPALGNGDARNRFMQAQLEDPQNQVPVSSLGPQDFGRFASREGLDPKLSVARMEALREAEVASQPKPMTPKELADYEGKLIANETNRIKLNELQNPPAPPAPPEPVYMESALDAIDDAITLVGKDSIFNPTAGFGSETAKSIGGSDAADLEAALSTITSAVGFKRLQDMREASPTGGALGSVSERELSQLNAALGSISQKQSPEQLKKNLLKIKDHYQKAVDAINAQRIAYNSGLTFKTQEEALKYIQSQKSSNAIKTDQGDYSIEGLSVEAQ